MTSLYPKAIIVLGPTACGKTALAVALARQHNGEIVSADSRQVYRHMDIGTGKDLSEYGTVPYHLIDIVDPTEQYSVTHYQRDAYAACEAIIACQHVPIICGGTGLYVWAVARGYTLHDSLGPSQEVRDELSTLSLDELLQRLYRFDPETYQKIDRRNRRRVERALEIYYQSGTPKSQLEAQSTPPYNFLKLGITFSKQELEQRIRLRLEQRLAARMVAEVERLHQQYHVSWSRLDQFGLEYRYIAQYLQGAISYDVMVEQLYVAICQFAKRQMTWFKRDAEIRWIQNHQQAFELAGGFLRGQ